MLMHDTNSKNLLDTIGNIVNPQVVKEEEKKEDDIKDVHVDRLIDLLKTRANELRVSECGNVELLLPELAEKICICVEAWNKVDIVVCEGEGSAESIDKIEVKGDLAKKLITCLAELLARGQGNVVPQQGAPVSFLQKLESLKK